MADKGSLADCEESRANRTSAARALPGEIETAESTRLQKPKFLPGHWCTRVVAVTLDTHHGGKDLMVIFPF
jgi:hypothetical protein